jgi:regulation of enolase protein 1 (concanavalin A-like superfamily)
MLARQGLVETRTGAAFEGHVRFESNLLVVVDLKQGRVARIPATNLVNLTFEPPKENSPAVLAAAETDSLPAPWRMEDVGSVSAPAPATLLQGILCLHSAGTNVAGNADSCAFVFKPARGDCELAARVAQLQWTVRLTKAGLMMRESLSAGAPHVALAITPSRGGVFQRRTSERGSSIVELQRDLTAPGWLKLKRRGDDFSAYRSRDGDRWTLVSRVTLPMAQDMFIGLFATSGRADCTATATFDRVQAAPVLFGSAFVPQVHLQSGSVVTGAIRLVDDTAVHFWGAPPREPISTFTVARIVFQWVSSKGASRLAVGKPGVLLASGDFLEGDFIGMEHGRVRISSVLHGLRSFDTEGEVAAVVLRQGSARLEPWSVKTVDGSVWLGKILEIAADEVVLKEASLGRCRVPIYELREVRWLD